MSPFPRSMNNAEISEKVAYWFFRLNGCATIENFVVHPDQPGSQETDVDILAIRFPHRCELFTSQTPMEDHHEFKAFPGRIQVIFAEVKGRNHPCSLNGPWTKPGRQNMHRVLYAIGAFSQQEVPDVATKLYRERLYYDKALAVRLFAIGARKDNSRRVAAPVIQLTWDDILTFIYSRMREYRQIKSDHSQWDPIGDDLYQDACHRFAEGPERYVQKWKDIIGVLANDPIPSRYE